MCPAFRSCGEGDCTLVRRAVGVLGPRQRYPEDEQVQEERWIRSQR